MSKRPDEQKLISSIISRDRRALSQFYRRYTPKLFVYIKGKINNPADAEEILQDSLFAFLEAIRDFQGTSSLTTFLYSIANHKIIDFYRKRKIKQLVFSQMPNLEILVSHLRGPEEELDYAMLREKIHHAMNLLVPRYKSLLVSKYIENKSVADIARKFTLTIKGAESQLFRARKAFVEAFVSM